MAFCCFQFVSWFWHKLSKSWLKNLSNEYKYVEQNPNRTRDICLQSWPFHCQKRPRHSLKFWRQVPENWQVTKSFMVCFFLSWGIDCWIKSEKTKSGRITFLNFNHPISHCIFQAEIYAISVCVKHCLNENYHRKSIDICSDSQTALKALSSINFRSNLVLECRKLIMRLAESNTVRLIWVPGHHDVYGNEIADELAREGTTTDLVGHEPALPLTRSLVKSIICDEAYQKHIQYWKNLPKCRHSKFFLKEPLTRAAGGRFFNSKNSIYNGLETKSNMW